MCSTRPRGFLAVLPLPVSAWPPFVVAAEALPVALLLFVAHQGNWPRRGQRYGGVASGQYRLLRSRCRRRRRASPRPSSRCSPGFSRSRSRRRRRQTRRQRSGSRRNLLHWGSLLARLCAVSLLRRFFSDVPEAFPRSRPAHSTLQLLCAAPRCAAVHFPRGSHARRYHRCRMTPPPRQTCSATSTGRVPTTVVRQGWSPILNSGITCTDGNPFCANHSAPPWCRLTRIVRAILPSSFSPIPPFPLGVW